MWLNTNNGSRSIFQIGAMVIKLLLSVTTSNVFIKCAAISGRGLVLKRCDENQTREIERTGFEWATFIKLSCSPKKKKTSQRTLLQKWLQQWLVTERAELEVCPKLPTFLSPSPTSHGTMLDTLNYNMIDRMASLFGQKKKKL